MSEHVKWDISRDRWHRSTFCDSGACVEVMTEADAVQVRNSADPGFPLVFTKDEWNAFIAGVLEGEFDA